MAIDLYSKSSVDTLLAAKLSISSLSNAAATTLNATAPTTDQVLSFDGTELKWATVSGGGGLTISTLSNGATSTLNATAPTTGQALTFDGTDLVWATVGGGGGSASWGGITGTLSDQTDLWTALGNKADVSGASAISVSGSSGVATLGTDSGGSVSADNGSGSITKLTPTGITFSDSTTQTTAATFDQKRAIANSIASCFSANIYTPVFQFVGHVALATYISGKYDGTGSYRIGLGYPGSAPTSLSLTSSSDSSGNVIANVSYGWTSISGMAVAYSEDGGSTWTYSDLVF